MKVKDLLAILPNEQAVQIKNGEMILTGIWCVSYFEINSKLVDREIERVEITTHSSCHSRTKSLLKITIKGFNERNIKNGRD